MNPVPTPAISRAPSAGRVVRCLKDGYWDLTEVIELPDGSQRVRKRNKAAPAPGPWGLGSLRKEIRYLTTLSPRTAAVFPTVRAWWDRETGGLPDVGYEMSFHPSHHDAGRLAGEGALAQEEIENFQQALAEAVLERVHVLAVAGAPLSRHLDETVVRALDGLAAEPDFARLVEAPEVTLNGRVVPGPRKAWERIGAATDTFVALDAVPTVRLHGDFFLENILWRREPEPGGGPRLLLIDPVSVAGISVGPPLFDLVKYESYATGELLALRTETIEVAGFGESDGDYRHRVRWQDARLRPFQARDWHASFRRAFEAKHGTVDRRLYHLLDGYFSLAMALNTFGIQRQGRLLKATADFAAVLEWSARNSRSGL